MTISEIVTSRGIKRVVHFTTANGALGILAKRAVLSRQRLTKDQYLEHILHLNCSVRIDSEWEDFVNLSIQNINHMFFQYSARWHGSVTPAWFILAFHPEVLSHEGVWFCTTNNSYPTVLRGKGSKGLSNLYAETVAEKAPYNKTRYSGMPDAWPTSPQAEVLYPEALEIKFLQCIYAQRETDAELLAGQAEALGVSVKIKTEERMFYERAD